jgi:hypothetical protein
MFPGISWEVDGTHLQSEYFPSKIFIKSLFQAYQSLTIEA